MSALGASTRTCDLVSSAVSLFGEREEQHNFPHPMYGPSDNADYQDPAICVFYGLLKVYEVFQNKNDRALETVLRQVRQSR